MNKKIVVFGASGFIGGHLLRKLVKEGNYKIVGVDLVSPKNPVPSVEYVIGDVRDLSSFDIDGDIQLVVNLAAIHKTPGHPEEAYYETNILGAVEISKFARRKNIHEIIFTSSISVYGPGEETKTENSPLLPTSAYGWSKMIAEKAHLSWMEEATQNRLIICRPAVIFGANEGGNFSRLTKLLKKGFFIYPGRKDTIKACFYVEDLIDALLFAWKQQERFVLFNGCYPDRFTIEEIVETFRATHFPKVKTLLFPLKVILAIAAFLKPFSIVGLGIHPDRVMKLVRSTDVIPNWLQSKDVAKTNALIDAFDHWKKDSDGRFD
ncbi:MAG: NAD(P)-dependent oxidoreductase [Alphaproteobacteria bacterium]|nr:NAD(P)-dependent oxidoreductase [Alphaproteobacteria bacterium]